ncbi:MAG TPA: ribonuclease HIII [Victivallales bacterium]|nr:ribonuclease HIII [Victivallales bacterium]
MPQNKIIKNPEDVKSHVCEITEEQVHRLEKILRDKGWEFREHPYAHWKALWGKMNVVAYKSGKLVIQGEGTGELVLFTIEPEVTGKPILGYVEQDFQDEKIDENYEPHAGVDESGKGDLFGSLVIASVYVDKIASKYLKRIGVRDSKNIKSDAKIAFLSKEIKRASKGFYTVVTIGPKAYNRLYERFKNLNRLLAWGHSRAIENLLEKKTDIRFIISDKFADESLLKKALFGKGKNINLLQKTKAESDIAVAAASIIARQSFIDKMKELSEEAGFTIPRGAGDDVKKALKRLVNEKGKESLVNFAKLHFKTIKELLGEEQEKDSLFQSGTGETVSKRG